MKALLLAGFVLTNFATMVLSSIAQAQTKIEKAVKYYWTCSMHPEVHMSGPGQCPICHMDLIKRQEKVIEEKSMVQYRKSVAVDKESFNLSGAKLVKVKKGNINYTIKSFGKMNGGNNFVLYVAEKDQRFLKTGNKVFVNVPSRDLETIEGKITKIDSYIDPMGRTIRVDGSLNSNEKLLAETSLLGTIHFQKDDVVKVPEDAILHTGENDYTFVLDEKKSLLVPTKVRVGLEDHGEIEIISGLTENETVTSGVNFLIDSESRMRFNQE